MGQTVFGIMYGCRLPDPPRRCEDDLDIYTDRAVDRANTYEGGGVERDAGLVGLWVAVGGSGIEHAARLDYVCVEFADKALRAHPEIGPFVRDAVKSWPEFVEHMQEVDVLLSRRKPKLWLTTTEVA
jgi:hypothetical protein